MSQTKREIQALLAEAEIRPLKRYGQHFLIDGNLMARLVDASEVTRDDVVVEVGPGTGALTDLLVESAGHVIAVEVDRGLYALLSRRYQGHANLTLLHQDVLAGKTRVSPAVISSIAAAQASHSGRVMLVANLPYQIATPLLADFLLSELPISPMCFTVQAEVGERFTAQPGNKIYGPISIFAQAMGQVGRIARVPASAFWPVPKVESVMVRIDTDRKPPETVRKSLHRVVHACFNHRRKTMRWSLNSAYGDGIVADVLDDGRWDLSARPERLAPDEWMALAAFLSERDGLQEGK